MLPSPLHRHRRRGLAVTVAVAGALLHSRHRRGPAAPLPPPQGPCSLDRLCRRRRRGPAAPPSPMGHASAAAATAAAADARLCRRSHCASGHLNSAFGLSQACLPQVTPWPGRFGPCPLWAGVSPPPFTLRLACLRPAYHRDWPCRASRIRAGTNPPAEHDVPRTSGPRHLDALPLLPSLFPRPIRLRSCRRTPLVRYLALSLLAAGASATWLLGRRCCAYQPSVSRLGRPTRTRRRSGIR